MHIRRLRKALEDFGYDRFIQTVRGSGIPILGPHGLNRISQV